MYKVARNLAVLGAGLGISAVVGWLFLREHRRNRSDDAPVLLKSQIRAEPMDMPNIVLPLDSIIGDDRGTAGKEPSVVDSEDDLTRINDIGPRFADALRAVGITSYAQLAAQTPDKLAEKLVPHVRVTVQRIQDKNWIGQAAQLARR